MCRLHQKESAAHALDRKSTRLNSSQLVISYAVFCLKKRTFHVVWRHNVAGYRCDFNHLRRTPAGISVEHSHLTNRGTPQRERVPLSLSMRANRAAAAVRAEPARK